MGVYLNSKSPYLLYRRECASTYFVDKTELLKELIPVVESEANLFADSGVKQGKEQRYICITRPRRFGKTVMANMIASYFGKGVDSSGIFRNLKASKYDWFSEHLNKHNVIHIMFNETPRSCKAYEPYISRIERRLLQDLQKAYPEVEIDAEGAVWDALKNIVEYREEERFIFVLDEWDFIYHQDFVTDEDKKAFTKFLSVLLKDQPYVEMAYMTGILPIASTRESVDSLVGLSGETLQAVFPADKPYCSGSELNMFLEYSMATREKYSEYFGFTDEEVDALYQRYLDLPGDHKVTREGLKIWYDGYQTATGVRLYNPRSVVGALSDNQLGSYWTSSGPYDEIYYYVRNDISGMRDEISLMMTGTPVPANIQEYASTSLELKTKDEIYSAMVVYGFLSYADGCVSIPNKELMDQFADMVRQKPDFGYMYRLAVESGKMLMATKAGDTKTMAEILERVHDTESPLIRYSDEAELAKVITFVYLQARETYDVRQEDRAGKGYVDYIFYPYNRADDGIIVELKVDDTPDSAIRQIKERNYARSFDGKLGEEPKCTGRILAVGIAYNRKDVNKRHACKVEVLRERSGSGAGGNEAK